MTAVEMFTVKLSFDGQLRRFPIDGSSFAALYEQIISLLSLEKNSELILKYSDEQGDLITMSSDMELKSALVKGQILRVVATYKDKDVVALPAAPSAGEMREGMWYGCRRGGKFSDKECNKKERKLCKKMWKQGALHHGSFGPRHGPFVLPHHGPFGPRHGPFAQHHGPHDHRGPFGHPHGAFGPHARGPFGFGHCNPEKFARFAKEKGMWKMEKGCKKGEKFALYAPLVDAVLANEHLQHVKRHKVFRMLRKCEGDKEKVIDVLTKKAFKKAEKLNQVEKGREKQKEGGDLMAF